MSFENPDNINKKTANLAVMVIFTVVAGMVAIFVPFISFAGLAFLPVPTALLFVSKRYRDAAICAIAGLLFVFIINYVIALALLTVIVSICFLYGDVISKKRSISISLAVLFSIFAAALVLFFLMDSAIAGKNTFSVLANGYREYIDLMPEDPVFKNYQGFLLAGGSELDTVIGQTQSFLRFIPKILPGILAVFFSIVSVLNYYFSYLFFRRFDKRIEKLPEFKYWDFPWYWCWGVILGIIFVVVPSFNVRYDMLFDVAGYNLIIIFGSLYLVLGTAALWGLLDRIKVGYKIRIILIIVLFLFFGFFLILPLFGLIDIWANFRKLKRT